MKNVVQKVLALLLVAVMLCGMMPAVSHAASGYSISAEDSVFGTAKVRAGETVKLSIVVDGAPFNGMEAMLVYNKNLLRLESAEGAAVQSFVNNGVLELYTLRHQPYAAGTCVAELVFTALGDMVETTASFELRGATAGDYDVFISGDAQQIPAYGDEVTIKPHSVIKPDLFEGNAGVKHGGVYMFRAADSDYSYGLPAATMNGEPVKVVDMGGNRWRIENVTGDIVIVDPRGDSTYDVVFGADEGIENIPENGTVTAGEDFVFTVPTLKGYAIGVEVRINGVDFAVEIVDGKVTIPGNAIVGDVSVYFTKTVDNECTEDEHVFEEPVYKWSSNYSTCTAVRVCGCGEKKEEETVRSTVKEDENGKTYTAQFQNPAFEKQVKAVEHSNENITVRFRLIGDGIHDDGAEGHEKYVTWIPTRTYEIAKGSTVLDLLVLALAENGLSYECKNDYYLNAITAPAVLGGYWLYNGDNGPISGWMYTAGGIHPQVVMSAYELKENEYIIVHYCDDFTKEESPGAPHYQRWLEAADISPEEYVHGKESGTEEKPGETVTVIPNITVQGDKATANVTSSAITGALEEAKNNGKVESVTITPTTANKVDSISVNIPKVSVSEVAQSGLKMTVEMEMASVKISTEALEDVSSQPGRTVSVSAQKTENDEVSVSVSVDGRDLESVSGGIVVSLPVESDDQDNSSKVLIIVDKEGKETIVKKSDVTDESVSGLLDGSAVIKITDNKKEFDDIENHWSESSVDFVASRELFNGVAERLFAPDGTMTRAMLVTVLHRLENEPVDEEHAHGFEDVEDDTWYSDAVAWANAVGIIEGHSDSIFDPNGEITREQMAVILYRYAEYLEMSTDHKGDLTRFVDHEETSDWAIEGKTWAVGAGIIEGKENNRLDPTGNTTRAEIATVLKRLIKLMLR